ncbi:hypothetical protein BD289DRAFT_486433 [Coniella lustricola]|uniref:Uncharacterized protein n=1 Tax=Coniella lustricola TaxID=2025994 RepID=A0A2T2ZV34_9PEZI|nr:hypothetical protein BD289DRAFT_486433 [Coniella lustricola]
MAFTAIQVLATAGLVATGALAACQASNDGGSGNINDSKLCTTTGQGTYTFAMSDSLTCVPDPSGGMNGCVPTAIFYILDESCNIRGTYQVPDCGVPFVIEENFLTQLLTVKTIDTTPGSSYFKFDYGNGEFVINNNHCDCVDASSGLESADKCKCAFPVDGTVDKRSINFHA